MKNETRPGNEEGGASQKKNICRFTSRVEAKTEFQAETDDHDSSIEVMVAYCPKCRVFGDFYFLTVDEAPIPDNHLHQECYHCGYEMATMIAAFNNIRALTALERSGTRRIPSLQVDFDFSSLIQEN
jgi:hypothetical protein